MTCGHCAAAVEPDVGAIARITEATIDLPTGEVMVASIHPIPDDEMTAAIDEAGYKLPSSTSPASPRRTADVTAS